MKIRVALLLAAVAVAGCTKTVAEMGYTERKQLAVEIRNRCYAQGVKPNSPEFSDCAKVEVQRETAMRQRKAAVEDARRSSDSGPSMCQDFGGNVMCF